MAEVLQFVDENQMERPARQLHARISDARCVLVPVAWLGVTQAVVDPVLHVQDLSVLDHIGQHRLAQGCPAHRRRTTTIRGGVSRGSGHSAVRVQPECRSWSTYRCTAAHSVASPPGESRRHVW